MTEAEMELRRRLMRHVIANWDEHVADTAVDGFRDLLLGAHEELLTELLRPLIEWSDCWPQRMAAEILGLDVNEDYDCRDLLDLFEGHSQESGPGEESSETNWKERGF